MKTPDKEQLQRLYWSEQRTLKEIAAIFNVSIPAIRQKMDRLGVPRRTNSDAQRLENGTSELTKSILENLYHIEGLSQDQIAQRYGITQSAIKEHMKKWGIKSRGKANIGPKNGMHGRSHTLEAKEKIRAANRRQFSSEEARSHHAELTIKQIAEGRTGKAFNLLETKFAAILSAMGFVYEQQYRLGRFVYDFYIPTLNALVEVHGTFWHADPRFYSLTNFSAIQHRNTANDKRKAERAKQDGCILLIFWEHDIDRIRL